MFAKDLEKLLIKDDESLSIVDFFRVLADFSQ